MLLGSTSGDRNSQFIFTLTYEGKVCSRGGLLCVLFIQFPSFGMQKKQFDRRTFEGMPLVLCQRLFFCIIGHCLCYMCLIPLIFMSQESSVESFHCSIWRRKKKKKDQQWFHQVLCWGDWQNIPSKISILAASLSWSLDKAACVRKATQFELGGHMRTWEHRLWS